MRNSTSIVASLVGGLIGLAATAQPALAQTYTWTAAVNNQWNTTTANWSGAGTQFVSSPTSAVTFADLPDVDPVLAVNVTVRSITQTGGTLGITGAGVLTLATPATITAPLHSNTEIDVPIAGTAGLTVTDAFVRLRSACTYSGPTVLSAAGAVLVDGQPDRLPIGTDVFVNGWDGGLYLNASQQIAGLNGSGYVQAYQFPATLTVGGSAAGSVHSGQLSDALRLRKVGSGTQTVGSSFSDYSGGTSIEGGTLIAAGSNALGTGAVDVQSGATLGLSGVGLFYNPIGISGSGAPSGLGAIQNISGANTISSQVTVNSDVWIGATGGSLSFPQTLECGSFAPTFSIVSGSSVSLPTVHTSATVTKTGAGELLLLNTCGFNSLHLLSGRVKVGHQGALSTSGTIDVMGLLGGQIDLGGTWAYVGPVAGGDTTNSITSSSSGSAGMYLNVPTGNTANFGGIIADGAGRVGITKNGGGTWVLTANQQHTGATTVSGGTLTVSGSLGNTPVTINGGTLDGNGNLGGTLAMSSGILSGTRAISGAVNISGGNITPAGTGQGVIFCSTGATFTGGTLTVTVFNSPAAYDRFVVGSGNLDLGSGVANLVMATSGSFIATPIMKYFPVINAGAGTTTGFFAGLPEFSEVTAMAGWGGQPHWFIYYHGDSASDSLSGGNDVAICPIAPPTLRNGSFELGNGSSGTLSPGATNCSHWVVTRGSTDWTTSATWPAAEGTHSFDLQGFNASGGVRQFVGLQPGTRYRLTFALAGNPAGLPVVKHMRARVNATELNYDFDVTGKTLSNMGWTDKSFVFIGSGGNTEIEFYSTDPASSWGAVVDNVRLIAEPCVPDVAGFGGSAGRDGRITVDDLVFFLNRFFGNDLNVCDIVAVGGAPGSDGLVTVDDLVAFLSGFFAGCP